MRLLLDTHILLWVLRDAVELTSSARTMIRTAEAVFVSSVCMWEITVKSRLGKLDADPAHLYEQALGAGFEPLSMTCAHALAVAGLPPLHRDPFDRMLVAQAVSEPLHLITHDRELAAYGRLVTFV